MEKRNIGIVLLLTTATVVGVIIWGVRQPKNSQVENLLEQEAGLQ